MAGSLLCRCGRGTFSHSAVAMIVDNPQLIDLEGAAVLRCVSCGIEYAADLRQGKQRLVPLIPSKASDKIFEEVRKDEWDSKFEQGTTAEKLDIADPEVKRCS